jgi:hypothetical protein
MTTTTTRTALFGATAVVLLALIGAAISLPSEARANPSRVETFTATAAASTTLAYITPGTGTTTLTRAMSGGNDSKFDKAVLAIQVTATSTGVSVPTLMVRFEDSRNCVDYYPRTAAPSSATTTLLTADPYQAFSLRMASSTAAPGSTDTATRLSKSIVTDVPLNCVRAVLYSPSGGGSYGVYAELIGIKEKQ